MNQNDFNTILQQPQAISKDHIEELKSVIEEFPYLQSARATYLKALKNADSYKYNHTLKTTAAYTTDRSILFDFITSESFAQNEISKLIQQNTTNLNAIEVTAEDISVTKSVSVNKAIKGHIKQSKDALESEMLQPKIKKQSLANFELDSTNTIKAVEESNVTKNTSAEQLLNVGKPLNFDRSETHSFNEWLSLTSFKPIKRQENEVSKEKTVDNTSKKALKREEKFELIDQFISKNPKIDPHKSTAPKHNIAKAQMIQPEALMTETLARIYVEQKNYSKAIQSYKILSLKYPEKSGFFADQIKAVKQLQEKNKE
ncbi:hypothetical protein [Lacinutrix salivirga]